MTFSALEKGMKMSKKKVVFAYRLTHDTGLAPCVDNGLLSLAVCKGGQVIEGKPTHRGSMRYHVGKLYEKYQPKNDLEIYLLGFYHDKMLYFAQLTDVMPMEKYYSGLDFVQGREDNIYEFDNNGEPVRSVQLRNCGPCHDDDDVLNTLRDFAGEYVLMSENFIYFGNKAIELPELGRRILEGVPLRGFFPNAEYDSDNNLKVGETIYELVTERIISEGYDAIWVGKVEGGESNDPSRNPNHKQES
jgi:hypothetical protein